MGSGNSKGHKYETNKKKANLLFYRNQKRSNGGYTIEEILSWKGNYGMLENNHQYIQWLFPHRKTQGVNPNSYYLQEEEAEEISTHGLLRDRVFRAFEMMLDFYGMEILYQGKGKQPIIMRNPMNWKDRFKCFHSEPHNYLKITRILKALAEFAFEKYQVPWLFCFINEAFKEQTLPYIGTSTWAFWIDAILYEEHKELVNKEYKKLKMEHHAQHMGITRQISQEKLPVHSKNVLFYLGRIKSEGSMTRGYTIFQMLSWKGHYSKLEENHQFIQWLFPIPDGKGMNHYAQPLQEHEAAAFRNDWRLYTKVIYAFEMMLDFYGMEMHYVEDGQVIIRRSSKIWKERFAHLNKSPHNYRRITRIIKCLGEFGLWRLQAPWLKLIFHEAFTEKTLSNLAQGPARHWIDAMTDEKDIRELRELYHRLSKRHERHDIHQHHQEHSRQTHDYVTHDNMSDRRQKGDSQDINDHVGHNRDSATSAEEMIDIFREAENVGSKRKSSISSNGASATKAKENLKF